MRTDVAHLKYQVLTLNLCSQLSGNKIPDFSGLDKELKSIAALRTLYLEANPCEINDRVHYRRKVILALPQLTQIDATYVNSCFEFPKA